MHGIGLSSPVVVTPARLWGSWALDPLVLAGLASATALYARGWAVLRRRGSAALRGRQAASFAAGLVLVAVALVSPLDSLATTLLSAHMVQHLILLTAAPPLLLYGRPGLVTFLGLPEPLRRRFGALRRRRGYRRALGAARNPVLVVVATTAALWGWHLPGPYQAAVADPVLHAAEHLTFLLSALAFWSLVVDPGPRRRLGYGPAIPLVVVTMLAGAALGAIITFAPTVLYPVYAAAAPLWGTTALADQQLAGAIMWVPPGAVLFVTAVVLAIRWFEDLERRVPGRQSAVAGAPAGPAHLPFRVPAGGGEP